MDITEKARRILSQPVCDSCLGRQFAQLLSGYSNAERGRVIRTIAAMSVDKEKCTPDMDMSNFYGCKFHNLETKPEKEKLCVICNGLFRNLEKWADKISKNAKKYEFSTFLIGTKLSFELITKEEELWERVGIDYCEPIKAEINRELGKLVEGKTKTRFNPKNPDINFIVDFESGEISAELNPLFIYGGYQKLVRGIPQTKWPSGKYKTSVEQIIAKPFMLATKGKAHKLHGCVSGNTKILLNECTLPISELEETWKEHNAITFNEKDKKIEVSKIEDFMKIKLETLKIKTKETGREIVASREHPFYTPSGMTPLANLKAGDFVAINPVVPLVYTESEERIIVDEQQIVETIEEYIPTSYKSKIIKELKERNLLPLGTTSTNILVLTRILAFLFGDGNVRYVRNRDVGLEFYGTEEDLKAIQNDLRRLKFDSNILRHKGTKSTVLDYYGNERIIEGKDTLRLVCYSKSFWTLLVALGAPVGNKVTKDFEVPEWIKKSGSETKREFLASLLGCEMDVPRLDNRKYNRKSFNTPRFSMNKIETNLDSMVAFMSDIKGILSEFGIETLKLRFVPYTTRKDGNKSIKVILDFNNNFENLINFYSKINFRYCKEKETYSKYVLEFLSMKKYFVDRRKELFEKALVLKKKGLTLSEIHRNIDDKYVNKKDLWLWISNKIKPENIKVPNDFPDFNIWLNDATKGLKDGLVWETIESIERNGEQTVYDLTVPRNHNFFANGFLVSNCGREDIDARCLAWRPFVLEILKPKYRNINLKKLSKKIGKGVKVRDMRLSSIAEVRKIKDAKLDKSYRCMVVCGKKISASDLKKLSSLAGTINQRTPQRVLHRRSDRRRIKKLAQIKTKLISNRKFLLTARCEAGLYVKELVSGDSGRTKPSIAEILGCNCTAKDLDVIKIHKK